LPPLDGRLHRMAAIRGDPPMLPRELRPCFLFVVQQGALRDMDVLSEMRAILGTGVVTTPHDIFACATIEDFLYRCLLVRRPTVLHYSGHASAVVGKCAAGMRLGAEVFWWARGVGA
jgi:hypothetical protein